MQHAKSKSCFSLACWHDDALIVRTNYDSAHCTIELETPKGVKWASAMKWGMRNHLC